MVRAVLSLSLAALFVLAPAPPAQAAKKQCLSKWGRTVCGYHCKAKFGRVKCAKTPQGKCFINHGVVRCWDPPSAGAGSGGTATRPAQCLSAHGTTVCGYGCKKAYGKIRCSQYPGGRCWKDHGRIKCTDDTHPGGGWWKRPPPLVSGPKAQCVTKYGRTVCGYNCVAKYSQAKCSRTPYGVCKAKYSRIHCWDPPHVYKGMPKARCKTSYGAIACGYSCKAKYGQVKCAKTPKGICKAAYGRITCWDPPTWDAPSSVKRPK